MKYVLLMLLFTTAPSAITPKDKGTSKDHRAWALQSSTSLELATKSWCETIAKNMASGVDATATMTVRMYCIPKDEATFNQDNGRVAKTPESGSRVPESVLPLPPLKQSDVSKAIRVN